VLATAAVYVAVAGAGLLGAPALTRLEAQPRRRLVILGATLATYAAFVVALAVRGELPLGRAAVAIALTLVGASALGLSSRAQLFGGAALAAGQVFATYEGGATNTAAVSIHLLAAAVWLGGVAHLALFGTTRAARPQLAAAVHRFTTSAVFASLALVGTGVVLMLVHHIGLGDLATSAFGNLIVVKTALLALAGALGLAHRTGRPWRTTAARLELLRVEAGVLAAALAFGAVLSETALPVRAVEFAAPGISIVDLGGGQSADLQVVAQGRDSGVVRLLSNWSVQLIDRVARTSRQLDPGQVAQVRLRSGVAALRLVSGDSERAVDITAAALHGSLDFQLGRAIALSGGGKPARSLCGASDPAADGAALGSALRAQGVDRLSVVTDESTEATGLLAGLSRAGVAQDQHAHTVLIATSESLATSTLHWLSHRPAIIGVYLAPWLLDSRVLSLLPNLRLPPVTVAATADVTSPLADRYRAALAAVADGVGPSVEGLRGYESIADPTLQQQSLTLYAAAPVGFLPGVLNVGHDHDQPGWFSSGTLVPVSAAVRMPNCHHPTT